MAPEDISGVALIVVNPAAEVLILREFQAKPEIGKFPGMFSIPMETREGDEPDSNTLVRLAEQELPGLGHYLGIPRPLGTYRIVRRAEAALYMVQSAGFTLPCSRSDEVGNYFWRTPEESVKLWLRQGAKEMLEDFMEGRWNVVRECAYIAPPPCLTLNRANGNGWRG